MSNMFSLFNTSASALSAQSVRLNTVASNLANANTAATNPDEAYRAKQVLFQSVMDQASPNGSATAVRVAGVTESQAAPNAHYEPHHPQANEEGYIFRPAISVVEEMANMMSASRNYEANVEVMETSRQLLQRTLQIGQG
ncbi:flagellar basal body rod protein FlgC [Thioalkalivibrio sp. ALE9]|uniref:flagellar basal body rod protein FlgC n=1 Tax=Thioalkalivibrio sp. ALE9 TaxID=1158169 RepID=UPI000365817E|nr:flagellar basal body rod protein FlgC [Thioalkalivibrio sp. ALE9]